MKAFFVLGMNILQILNILNLQIKILSNITYFLNYL